ncbi:hypothetical protein FORC16_0188 [Vibrio vulnificus]|nr:hypothetical protein FORC16_0188 [Vibrio vulnificus]
MLKNLVEIIKKNKINSEISVIFHDVSSMPNELNGINRIRSSNRKEYLKAIAASDVLIWGGGTCFYDAGSKAENRGLTDLLKIGTLCKIFNTKMFFLGVGIGKITPQIEFKIKSIFKLSNSIFFRDEDSLIESKKYIKNKASRSGDLALLLNVDKYKCKEKRYITYSGVYNYDLNIDDLVILLEYISKLTNSEVAFLPCHRSPHDDNISHLRISEKLNVKYKIFDVNSIDEYIEILSQSKFHIGVRLHSIVLADLLSIPNLGIEYSPKIRKYIHSTGVLEHIRSNKSPADISYEMINEVINNYTPPSEYIAKENGYSTEAIKRILDDINI